MININSVSFSYGEHEIFKNFSLEIPDGIVCLRGASGCGKTTLLRLIAGFLKPSSGEISGTPDKISFMFQEDRLLPWYTAEQNVAAVLPKDKKDEAARFLRAVELGDKLSELPDNLSGGQRRRIAIARMLSYGGELFIMDEPFKGLDTTLIQKLISLIKEQNVPVIVTSHSDFEIQEWNGTIIDL